MPWQVAYKQQWVPQDAGGVKVKVKVLWVQRFLLHTQAFPPVLQGKRDRELCGLCYRLTLTLLHWRPNHLKGYGFHMELPGKQKQSGHDLGVFIQLDLTQIPSRRSRGVWDAVGFTSYETGAHAEACEAAISTWATASDPCTGALGSHMPHAFQSQVN